MAGGVLSLMASCEIPVGALGAACKEEGTLNCQMIDSLSPCSMECVLNSSYSLQPYSLHKALLLFHNDRILSGSLPAVLGMFFLGNCPFTEIQYGAYWFPGTWKWLVTGWKFLCGI